VKQRFLVLFRRWLVTVAKVFGPILLFEAFVSVRQYLQLTPLGVLDLLMGVFMSLLLTAALCGLWAWGEWSWSKTNRSWQAINLNRPGDFSPKSPGRMS
jgi:hypothetical protein